MTTITIQSNFQAQKIINALTKDNVNFTYKREKSKVPVTLSRILDAVAKYHKISKEEIIRKCRKRELVYIRAQFVYIAADRIRGYSLGTIGRYLGGKDHSTIIYHRDIVREAFEGNTMNLPHNKQIKKDVLSIMEML